MIDKKEIKMIIDNYFNKDVDIKDTLKSLKENQHDGINLLMEIEDELGIELNKENISKLEAFDGKINTYINKIIKLI